MTAAQRRLVARYRAYDGAYLLRGIGRWHLCRYTTKLYHRPVNALVCEALARKGVLLHSSGTAWDPDNQWGIFTLDKEAYARVENDGA